MYKFIAMQKLCVWLGKWLENWNFEKGENSVVGGGT